MGIKRKVLLGTIGLSLFSTGAYAGTVINQYKTPRGNMAVVEKEDIHKNRIGLTVNGKKVESNTWYSETEKTYVPLREVAELLGAKVDYNSKTWAADITTADYQKPSDLGKSRSNPAKLNQKVLVTNDDFLKGKQNFEITLTDVVSGPEAWAMIKEANMFNEAPGEGEKYILAKFKVKTTSLENEPMEINNSIFKAVSKTGVLYNDFVSVVTPDPDISTELYEGAEHEGWAFFLVDETDQPEIVLFKGHSGETWFDLGL